jgi:diguanylate cyclase (GGDEF)-like protein
VRLTSTHSSESPDISATALLPTTWSIVALIAALLMIFELDRRTGSTPVQHLYYLPLIFAGVRFAMRGGITAALAAILLYHLANPHLVTFQYEESDFVQIALFITVSVITAKLAHDAQRLHTLAMTDDLTGLHNLRSFEARLGTIMRASREARQPICMLVLDLDRLKTLNDKYGHLTGAEAVRTVGHIIAASLPRAAVGCRYGGDEFVAVLPRCSESDAKRIADDLRQKVNAAAPVLAGHPFPSGTLSISIGLACHSPDRVASQWGSRDDESGEALFRAADTALYHAKNAGRNRVSVV